MSRARRVLRAVLSLGFLPREGERVGPWTRRMAYEGLSAGVAAILLGHWVYPAVGGSVLMGQVLSPTRPGRTPRLGRFHDRRPWRTPCRKDR